MVFQRQSQDPAVCLWIMADSQPISGLRIRLHDSVCKELLGVPLLSKTQGEHTHW